jgi:AH receptor-interacting protein
LSHIPHGCDTELFKIEAPGDYQKESWQMNEEEKLNAIPGLHAEGNSFFRDKDYKAAADKYAMAIGILEQLMLV